MTSENNEKEDNNAGKKEEFPAGAPEDNEEWGYDLYPDRKSDTRKKSIYRMFLGLDRNERSQHFACERNVFKCIENSPLVKLMMGALKSSGCEVDIRRHISCEVCYMADGKKVTGGYDPEHNQVIVCQNTSTSSGLVQGVLTHEMIHMFDYCRNHLDFKNLDHLACTEIRAANLTHCSFLSALGMGTVPMFNFKEAHQYCVKEKALHSVMAVRKVSKEVAMDAINRVFTKCYNDLEPIGRRIRRNSPDMEKAYLDGLMYGYEI